MAKRFGRNRKKKLLNEIAELSNKLATRNQFSPFESRSYIVMERYTYDDLNLSYKGGKYSAPKPLIKQDRYDLLETSVRIEPSHYNNGSNLLLSVKLHNNFEMRYMINTELVIDMFKNNIPMDCLYEKIYNEFVVKINEKLEEIK